MSTAIELTSPPAPTDIRSPLRHLLGAAVGGVVLNLTPQAAQAQRLRFDFSFETQVVATNNAGREAKPLARGDVYLDARPMLRARSQGGRLRLDMTVGLVSRTYARGTQENRVAPDINVQLAANVVQGWFDIEATARASSGTVDPFAGGGTGGGGDLPGQPVRQYRTTLAPVLRRELTPEWELQARSGHAWQRNDGETATAIERETTHYEDTTVQVQRRPLPVGFHAELRRQRQHHPSALRDETVLAIDSMRAGASYRITPQFTAGLSIGREHSQYLLTDETDTLVGVSADWTPTDRSSVRGTVEKRFFGHAYEVTASHRSPYLVLSGAFSRQPGLSPASRGTFGSGSNVASLLDSLLTTRIPNPLERATAVNRLMTERGLPSTLGQATDFVDQTPQLVRNATVSAVLLGVRHSVALSLFSRSARELHREGELALGVSRNDFSERGGTLLFTRRLTPTASMSLQIDRHATRGLGLAAGEYLREWNGQGTLNLSLSSRTHATFGLGRQLIRSNRTGDRQETRAHVGLLQNF